MSDDKAIEELSKKVDRWTLQDDSTIDYGYLAQTGGAGIKEAKEGDKTFYLTTAINYTNGPAHMGHAYEGASSDVISRFQRLKNDRPCYFVTGADEHGQKVATSAEKDEKDPQSYCDKYVIGFKNLNQRLLVSNDDYVRTTSDRHKRVAQELWKRCAAKGDIYLDAYSGWYNVKEETFVTDMEAEMNDYKDPASGMPLKRVEEESYLFKMSAYADRLIEHIKSNPGFIRPEQHRNAVLSRLTSDPLRDLSISRTTFSWGISVPEGFDDKHVMYVWIDALSNYLTGIDYFGTNGDGREGIEKFWPCDVHIIGKDILWFHTVIWPCLLMSADIPLPTSVYLHGFVNDREGKKMSKTVGNVVDPHDVLDKSHVDAFRWYLCKEAPYGGELSYNIDNMREMHNADLCDTLGNLVNRATNLCKKFCGGVVSDVPPPASPVIDLASVIENYTAKMNQYDLQGGAAVAIAGFRDINGYLQTEAPWLKKGDEHAEFRQVVVRATLEAIYALTHLLMPFLPVGCKIIYEKLGTEPVTLATLDRDCRSLEVGTKVEVGKVLYEKMLTDDEKNKKAGASGKKKESFEEAQKRKKEKKAAAIAASEKGRGKGEANQSDFTKMEIRVGKIAEVWNHESADKLFCEKIDCGEETGPREIASGLREFYTIEEMKDKLVLVVCNLKASRILGFNSNGMVLAAKGEDGKTELVEPPEGSQVGERVFIEGLTGEPFSSSQVKKKKVWNTVSNDLKTGEGGVATWQGKTIQTSTGPCKAASLVGAPIS
mmetsp:Transcript_15996/g.44243  ORF Transcript_15996/g.44243 Transcript_15996/m.44243 type:complete len:769 (-) Transcript_15996:85-2391(-)|eukprot:CAMPEP_0172360992 /NCGR_PEP_ID=MMETSP1060-20121228/4898_1 /TAXON_ID=37318 /ORGANISM="Pseudo-nitzschia pungens, Strain cf. cingulata" /LENGTH=768 /DNA_ID=CAMNT_0013083127 /DNA_START=183 /DNA_END=2489 /DNA_ORIENTATION=+